MKGCLILLGIVVASALFCGYIPFKLLPDNGIAMGLPVISVPGEKLGELNFGDTLGIFKITNTLVGTLLADIVVLLFAFGATRKMREVPGRLQGLFEIMTDALYGVAKSTAGPNARRIFPFMATLFLFVLTANWLELIPGVDSVGVMHCAEDGLSGYPTHEILGINVLKVEGILNSGERATEADYEACHEAESGHSEAVAHTEGEGEGEAVAEDAEVESDIHMVTPYVRAAATDLNLTLGLALLAVLVVQYFGVSTLGLRYFTKFVNTPALENAGKKPMGIMDFATGLLEIVSEISRIVSFGFRLFGNIFAGQVLLFVIPFLAGMLVPMFIYGFELFVGVIQAFVFGMLFLVFSAMAMQGHGHDETHEESH